MNQNSPVSRRLPLIVAVSLVLPVTGCSWFRGDKRTEVKPASFYQPVVAVTDSSVPTTHPSEPASYTPPQTPSTPKTSIAAAPIAPAVVTPPTPATVPGSNSTASLPNSPTPAKPVATVGTYMTVGGVLSEVNGVPIFASRVMRELDPVLSALAKDLDEPRFRLEARRKIESQVRDFELEELEVAAAQRNLGTDDKKLADMLTTDWRQKQIIAAGGSIEMARKSAADAGENFDELVKRQNRKFLLGLYYQKRLFPRVAITTNDMRKFYRENLTSMFTEHASVTFRLIRIDPARNGGKDAALKKIKDLRDIAVAGEDFGTIASKTNDDMGLSRRQGMVGTIAKGSLAMQKVEEAVFRTQPGQITEIVEDRGGFYIAKVEAKQDGSVKAFEDPNVQATISEELRRMQITELREKARAELVKNAIIRRDPKMIDTAMEMASQRYAAWRAQS